MTDAFDMHKINLISITSTTFVQVVKREDSLAVGLWIPVVEASLPKQKNPVTNDSSVSKDAMLSSSTFLGQSSGSSRRAAVSSSRDMMVGSEADHSRSRTTDASPGAFRRVVNAQRSSPVSSSEPKRSSGRNTSNIKNYESTLKGMECLNFDADERLHY
ncbi:hypothetical protein ACLOJK_039968 [Asimina triloba]